jgi:hypothetical protein
MHGTYPLDNRAPFNDDDVDDDDAFNEDSPSRPRGGAPQVFHTAPPPRMMPNGGYDLDREPFGYPYGGGRPPVEDNPSNGYGRMPGRGQYQTYRAPSESSV